MIDEMTAVSLGSGSTIPDQRPLAATYLRAEGDEYLIDAPEGVQRELLRRDIGLGIDTIFITNQAKRSLLGLPGLLNTLSHIGQRVEPLTIYCPPSTLGRTRSIVDWFNNMNYLVNVKELIPGRFEHIADNYRIDTLDTNSQRSYGLKFSELNVRGTFDREKAESLGVPAGPKFGKLCDGEPVETNSGSIVEPDDVLSAAPDPLSIVLSGRTSADDTIRDAAQNATILIHDAVTLERDPVDTNRSTVTDAVTVANNSQPIILALHQFNHSTARFSDDKLIQEAKNSQEGNYDITAFSVGTEITAAHDTTAVTHRAPR